MTMDDRFYGVVHTYVRKPVLLTNFSFKIARKPPSYLNETANSRGESESVKERRDNGASRKKFLDDRMFILPGQRLSIYESFSFKRQLEETFIRAENHIYKTKGNSKRMTRCAMSGPFPLRYRFI